jgi:NADPH:quinone reductase
MELFGVPFSTTTRSPRLEPRHVRRANFDKVTLVIPDQMRAIRVNELGGPEVLELTQRPVPTPRAGQVLLKVHSVGLNFADILNVRGEYLTRARVPFTPGMEFSGTVVALGEGVTHLQEGQLVAALGGSGAFAEYAVAPAAACLPIPANLDARAAAALPVSYFTAYFSLKTLGRVQAGEVVWVEAAAGALGTASIQLAKAMNCTVIATASTPEKLEIAKRLGADHVFLSGDETLRSSILEVIPKGVDIYLSVTGGHGFQDRLSVMNSLGRVMVIGNASRESANLNPTMLMKKNLSVTGVWLTPLLTDAQVMLEASGFMYPLLESGAVKPQIGQVFTLEDAGKAFDFVMNRQSTGKVLIEP